MTKQSILALPLSLAAISVSAAVYNVEEVVTPTQFSNAFAEDINASGQFSASVKGIDFNKNVSLYREAQTGLTSHHSVNATALYNHPIDPNKLDFEDENLINFLVTDQYDYLEDVKNGIFNEQSLNIVLYYLFTSPDTTNFFDTKTDEPKQLDGRYHAIGDRWAAVGTGTVLAHHPVTDTINATTNKYNFSHNETIYSINDNGVMVGATESPYSSFQYTFSDGEVNTYYIQDYIERGFVKTADKTVFLDPAFTGFRNGRSIATDVSNSGYVVGFVSTRIRDDNDFIADRLDVCNDRGEESRQPLEICLWQYRERNWSSNWSSRVSNEEPESKTGTQEHHAYRWKIDANGDVIEAVDLGTAYNQDADNTYTLYSRAFGVNEQGIAVGDSFVYTNNDETRGKYFATVFNNNEVEVIVEDSDGLTDSRSVAINNNGIVVGTYNRNYVSNQVTKSFYYDMATKTATPIDDAYGSSQTKAKAINNLDQVVGSTTVQFVGGSIERHGFIFDVNQEKFSDLNDLITCDSNYTITTAEAINDSGVILATATRTSPIRNIMGEVIVDDEGNTFPTSYTYVVKLTPIDGGQSEDCFQEENKIKRSGGSMHWAVLICLPLLRLFRRFQ